MKKLMALLMMVAGVASAGDLDIRHYYTTNDVSGSRPAVSPIRWSQGESVKWDLFLVRGTNIVDLTATNLSARMEAFISTNQTNAYILKTGTVTTATGKIAFDLTPAEANAPATNYTLYVKLYQLVDGTNRYVGQGFKGDLQVLWGPSATNAVYAGPYSNSSETDPLFTAWRLTNAYVKTETDPVFTASPTGNWNTAYGWGNHSTNGYVTATVTNGIPNGSTWAQYVASQTVNMNSKPVSNATEYLFGGSYGLIANPAGGDYSLRVQLMFTGPDSGTAGGQLINMDSGYLGLTGVGSYLNWKNQSFDVPFYLSPSAIGTTASNVASYSQVSQASNNATAYVLSVMETNMVTDATHGQRGGSNLHSLATSSYAGFLSALGYNALQSAITNNQPSVQVGYLSVTGTLSNAIAIYKGNTNAAISDNEFMTKDDVETAISSFAGQTLFGDSNAHPIVTHAGWMSFRDTIGTAWTNTYALATGTNYVGNRYYTNQLTSGIRAGTYRHHVYTLKSASAPSVTYYSVLNISDGTTTNVIGTNSIMAVDTTITAQDSSYYLPTNVSIPSGTNKWYIGVARYAVKTGAGVNLSIYGGGQYDTKLETPTLSIVGVDTSDLLKQDGSRPFTGNQNAAGYSITNATSIGFVTNKVTISTGVKDGTNSLIIGSGTTNFFILLSN